MMIIFILVCIINIVYSILVVYFFCQMFKHRRLANNLRKELKEKYGIVVEEPPLF